MAASTTIKTLYDGSVSLKDGTGTPVSLTVPFTTGDLSISGLSEGERNVVMYETRGFANGPPRLTTRVYPTGSFSFQLADYSDPTSNTVADFVLKAGSYASNVSTYGASAEVYAIDIVLTVAGTVHGDSGNHTITLADCVCTMDLSEGEPNTGTINYTCYGGVTIT